MNQITQGPNPTPNFGYDFDYAVWTPGTKVDLVSVPWNNDFRDVLKPGFDLNGFIDSLRPAGISIDKMTYIRPNKPIRIDIPFNRAIRYNYIRVTNPAQPIQSDVQKTFYYFILDANYIAPGTTELILQIDTWSTFINDVSFGNCYVERGHIGIANENQMQNYGRDYLNVPEGLDTGGEYVIAWDNVELSIANLNTDYPHVLVYSTTDLLADPGDLSNPVMTVATGANFGNIASGANVYIFDSPSSFTNLLMNLKNAPWITQGIISATLIPKITRYINSITWNTDIPNCKYVNAKEANIQGLNWIAHNLYSNWRNRTDITNGWPEKYRKLKKFFTSPYMLIEMTTYMGTPIMIKPENWRSPDAVIVEAPQLVPPNQRIVLMPKNYNSNNDNWNIGPYIDNGEYLDYFTIINSFPTLATVNNMAINYMAMNAHQISWSGQSAEWSQQRALGSNQAQYDIEGGAINTARETNRLAANLDTAQTNIGNELMQKQALVNSIVNPISSGTYGGIFGPAAGGVNFAGGLMNAIGENLNTVSQMDANVKGMSARNAARHGTTEAQTGQMSLARDTNKSLADWAARGDYANQIAGINAKIQDSRLVQPSVSGQIGGDAFLFGSGNVKCALRWKTIDQGVMAHIGDYWLRYGYTIQRFIKIPASLMVMSKFTYWKLTETYIKSSSVPEGFKQVLRGILEKGVTVWNSPDDIGNIDLADNDALPGVKY